MLRKNVSRLGILMLLCGLATATRLPAQTIDAEQRAALLKAANAKYYSLDKAGVESFTCNVEPDWDTLTWDRFTAPTLEAPAQYAAVIAKLKKAPAPSFTFSLNKSNHDSADVTIPDAPGVTADEKDAADSVQGVFGQMLSGYLKFWQDYFNGQMIPDDIKSVKRTPTGYALHESFGEDKAASSSDGSHGDYVLDTNMLLTSITTSAAGQEMRMNPTFTSSAAGALLTGADFIIGNAAFTKAGIKNMVSYKSMFAPVDGVMLPMGFEGSENILAKGKAGKLEVDMKFTGCTVKKKF